MNAFYIGLPTFLIDICLLHGNIIAMYLAKTPLVSKKTQVAM